MSMATVERQRRFEGKIVLVTGGAFGIGRTTVEAFAEEGARVVFSDVSGAGGELESTLRARDQHCLFQRSDATDETDVAKLVNTIVERFGRLDIAVNNVGNMAGGDR